MLSENYLAGSTDLPQAAILIILALLVSRYLNLYRRPAECELPFFSGVRLLF